MTSVIETIGTTSRILGHQVQSNRQKRAVKQRWLFGNHGILFQMTKLVKI